MYTIDSNVYTHSRATPSCPSRTVAASLLESHGMAAAE